MLLLGRIKHCTAAALIVLGIVTYLGVIGSTSKQVPSPSSHHLNLNLNVISLKFPLYVILHCESVSYFNNFPQKVLLKCM